MISPPALRVLVLSLVTLGSGCGTKGQASSDASSRPSLTPGEQCLAEAAAPRNPEADAPRTITVSHILIRHNGLERPEGATMDREAACLKSLEALKAFSASGDWDGTVQTYSDSGKESSGSLGTIERDEVTGAFGDAAFCLEPNEFSYVVESDRGFHIILRTD